MDELKREIEDLIEQLPKRLPTCEKLSSPIIKTPIGMGFHFYKAIHHIWSSSLSTRYGYSKDGYQFGVVVSLYPGDSPYPCPAECVDLSAVRGFINV